MILLFFSWTEDNNKTATKVKLRILQAHATAALKKLQDIQNNLFGAFWNSNISPLRIEGWVHNKPIYVKKISQENMHTKVSWILIAPLTMWYLQCTIKNAWKLTLAFSKKYILEESSFLGHLCCILDSKVERDSHMLATTWRVF